MKPFTIANIKAIKAYGRLIWALFVAPTVQSCVA